MPQTMATLEPVLKEVYTGSLNKQLNSETRAYNRITSSKDGTGTKPFGGKYVNFPIHISRNAGIGARNQGEALPRAGRQGTAEAFLNLRYQYGAIQIPGQIFELATKEYQTFIDAVDLEMDNIRDDLSKDRSRQYFGNGSGRVATVVSVSGQVITVDSIQHIQDEEILESVVAATGVKHGSTITVKWVEEGSKEVTVEGTTTGIVAGDILVREGSWNREWTGLGAIIDDQSTLYDIDPNEVRVWKSVVNNQGGTPTALSEATWMRMSDALYRNGGGATAILTTLGVQRAYWLLLSGQRRHVNTDSFGGGYKTLSFDQGARGPIPIIADIDAPAGQAIFVNEKQIHLYRPHEFKFMDRDGSMWKQFTDANGEYDAYRANLYEYSELGTYRRNSHGVVKNIIEDADV